MWEFLNTDRWTTGTSIARAIEAPICQPRQLHGHAGSPPRPHLGIHRIPLGGKKLRAFGPTAQKRGRYQIRLPLCAGPPRGRLRWTPDFGRPDKVEPPGLEAPYQEDDDAGQG